MKVIAKFRCNSIEYFQNAPGGPRRVKLDPVSPRQGPNGEPPSEEDRAFWKYTPSGHLEMTIDNPPATDMFEIGRDYYVTFEFVPPAAKPD